MLAFLLILGWVCSGVAAFGLAFAYFQGEFPFLTEEKVRTDYGIAVVMAICGPFGLVVSLFGSVLAKHGWRVRPSKRDARWK